ncbi:MAG: hypothetical protein NVS9B4_00870 [Candidatus Acidiferrum sp.]
MVTALLFNEGAGLQARDLTVGQVGTLAASVGSPPSWGVGPYGSELVFSTAASTYVTLGNPTRLQITDNITIMTSYNLTLKPGGGASGILVGKDTNTGRAYTFDVDNVNGLRLYIGGGTTIINEGRAPVAGDDRIAVASYQSTSGIYKLYVNGVRVNTVTAAASAIPAGANVLVGRREYPTVESPIDARIRYVYIWNRILGEDEVYQMYLDPYCFMQPTAQRQFWMQLATPPNASSRIARQAVNRAASY